MLLPSPAPYGQLRQAAQILLLFFFLCLIITVFPGFTNDVRAYQRWCLYIQQHGLPQAYGSDTNYPPLLQYLLWVFSKIAHSETLVRDVFYYFRSLVLLFDFWAVYLLWRWARIQTRYLPLLVSCLILNVAFIYNTIIWGQVDGVGTALIFAALYAACRNRPLASTLLAVLALNMKLQMIIFLPLWGLLVLYGLISRRKWITLLLVPALAVAAEALLLLPFAAGPGGIQTITGRITGNVGEMPFISIHAHNLWFLLFGPASRDLPDNARSALALTYRQWGLLLFFTASFFALLPLARHLFRLLRQKSAALPDALLVWQTGALLALLFFYCNTEMHERYQHPALLFLAALAFATGRFLLYILFSFAYFWNLEVYMQAFRWPNFVYNSVWLGGYSGGLLFGGIIVALYIQLYRRAPVITKKSRPDAGRDFHADMV